MSITSAEEPKRYGFVGILINNRETQGPKVNKILAEHAGLIIGRLGMPHLEEESLSIITLIVWATNSEIGSLTGKLGIIKGIAVKSALHKSLFSNETPDN